MSVASTFSTDGGAALYKEGDLAWYRQRDGTYVPAKVVSVDVTVDPPSYAVDLGGNIRETEGPRLRPRGPGDTAPPAAHTPAPALPPVQKHAANFGVPGRVSIRACSGSAPVLGDAAPGAASSANSWNPVAGSVWQTSMAAAPAADLDEDFGEDFGDFCDAEPDGPAAKPAAGQEGPLSNGASSPLQMNHNSTASSGALPPPVSMQRRGSGAAGASFDAFTHMPAPVAHPLAASSGSSAAPPLSFASLSAFRPSAGPPSFLMTAQEDTAARITSGADVRTAGREAEAAMSSFFDARSWPATVSDTSAQSSGAPHQSGTAAAADGDFGDFEAAEWQAPPPVAPAPEPAGHGASAAQLPGSFRAAAAQPAQYPGAGKFLEGGGGRGVTPASTIDIARDELDFGDGSDEDGFGDFEDAQSGGAPTDAPSAAVAALDRSAPLPMSLFGEDEDPAEATSPLPSLDLAAPWGNFGFELPEQAIPARQPSTLGLPAGPTLVLPSEQPEEAAISDAYDGVPWGGSTASVSLVPDQAAESALVSSAAARVPMEERAPMAFLSYAPATPQNVEHAFSAADATPLPALQLLAVSVPAMHTAENGAAAARTGPGQTDTGVEVAESVDFGEWADTTEAAEPGESAGTAGAEAAARGVGSDITAAAQAGDATVSPAPHVEADSAENAPVCTAAAAEENNTGSQQGIDWDALDFSFAEDTPDMAAKAVEPDLAEPAAHADVSTSDCALEDTPAVASAAGHEHSLPTGALTVTEQARDLSLVGATALPETSAETAEGAESAEQQQEAELSEGWGDFEDFAAAEDLGSVQAVSSHSGGNSLEEPGLQAAGSTTLQGPADSSTEPPASADPGAAAQWPYLAEAPPSAGVPASSAALGWEFLGGGADVAGAGTAKSGAAGGACLGRPDYSAAAESAGWGWGPGESWLAPEQSTGDIAVAADVWGALASLEPEQLTRSEPAHDSSPAGAGSVAACHSSGGDGVKGSCEMDEGGWGEEWAGPSITAEASPSETFAGHDRATAWCLLAHAAEAELARGQRIWLEACGAGRQAAFCANPHTRQYIAALGAVHFVACVLRAAQRQKGGCVVGGADDSTAIAEALSRCEDCWHNGMPGAPALKSAHAAAAAAETAALAAAVSEACGGLDANLGDMEEGTPLCALTLLPLTLCPAVHAVAFEGGLCWAPVANLWANRVRRYTSYVA